MTPRHYNFTFNGVKIDPYRILDLYPVRRAAQQHAIKELLDALKRVENRSALHSSDAAQLNANNDHIFKICRKALEPSDE